MKTKSHWGSLLWMAADIAPETSPKAEQVQHLRTTVATAQSLQFLIGNGLAALDSLLSGFDDELEAYQSMDLVRLLASLGEANLALMTIVVDGTSILSKSENK